MAVLWFQTPDAIIKGLISDKNSGFDSNRAAFTVGAASTYTPSDSSPRNTKVTISPIDGKGFVGDVEVHYKRIAFDDYLFGTFGSAAPTIPWYKSEGHYPFDEMTPNLIVIINQALGLSLDESDCTLYITSETTRAVVDIEFSAGNLLFLPGPSSRVTFQYDVATNTVITTTELDGLDLPT